MQFTKKRIYLTHKKKQNKLTFHTLDNNEVYHYCTWTSCLVWPPQLCQTRGQPGLWLLQTQGGSDASGNHSLWSLGNYPTLSVATLFWRAKQFFICLTTAKNRRKNIFLDWEKPDLEVCYSWTIPICTWRQKAKSETALFSRAKDTGYNDMLLTAELTKYNKNISFGKVVS